MNKYLVTTITSNTLSPDFYGGIKITDQLISDVKKYTEIAKEEDLFCINLKSDQYDVFYLDPMSTPYGVKTDPYDQIVDYIEECFLKARERKGIKTTDDHRNDDQMPFIIMEDNEIFCEETRNFCGTADRLMYVSIYPNGQFAFTDLDKRESKKFRNRSRH